LKAIGFKSSQTCRNQHRRRDEHRGGAHEFVPSIEDAGKDPIDAIFILANLLGRQPDLLGQLLLRKAGLACIILPVLAMCPRPNVLIGNRSRTKITTSHEPQRSGSFASLLYADASNGSPLSTGT
jgi:hypothetical protein